MKIARILGISIIAIITLWIANPIGISHAQDDFTYNPSQQFIKDFFTSLSGKADTEATSANSTIAFRRLYAIKEKVDQNDMITAWQMLISLPQIEGIPEIDGMRLDARAIQSVMPWYSDKELRENFISAFEEIWLKNKNLEDYGTFKEVFGGYASRRLSVNPAVYIRDNLGYYGYVKGSAQPGDDIAFIQNLFIDFSRLAEMSVELGNDYHSLNLNDICDASLKKIASQVDDAWHDANALEKARKGEVVIDEKQITESVSELLAKAEPEKTTKIDLSKLNVFKMPENANSNVASTEPEESDGLLVESSDEVSPPFASKPGDENEPEIDLNSLLNGEGLEQPEEVVKPITIKIPAAETAEPEIKIPSSDEKPEIFDIGKSILPVKTEEPSKIEKSEEPAKIEIDEGLKIDKTEKPAETVKSEFIEESVKSVFVSPKIEEIKPEVEETIKSEEPEKAVKIPKTEETPTEKPSEEVDLLKTEPKTPVKPAETKPVETKPSEIEKQPEPKPVEVQPEEIKAVETKESENKPVEIKPSEIKPPEPKTIESKLVETKPAASDSEVQKIAEDLTNQAISAGEGLGKLAIDLVVLWKKTPDNDKDYVSKESELLEKLRVKKEEFLSLLYIADAFKLEDDLGLTFDTYNGKIIASLMKGYEDFKESGGLDENPGITDEELLQAVGQLTEGVDSRRESLKIKNASLRAFRQRRSQFADVIAKLEKIKDIKIPE